MILDTSALLHVLFAETGWESSVAFLLGRRSRRVSVASIVEAQAVLAGRTLDDPHDVLERLLLELDVDRMPLTVAQGERARRAYLRYGRGSGHPARLNYGDVLSYALARDLDEPLACVGNDFGYTDLEVVVLPPR